MSGWSNIVAVARREFEVRVRTRSFMLGTVLLVVGVAAIAMVPVIVQWLDRTENTKVAVYVGASDLTSDPVPTLDALLNASSSSATPTSTPTTPDFSVSAVPDLAAARQAVDDGKYEGVLAIERAGSGQLDFTYYTNATGTGRTTQLIQQASTAIAIGDRLDRLGVAAADQASLFAPPTYATHWADPTRTGPVGGSAELGADYLLGFGMTILIFMMIILYGNWIAMSVVEEKSSRVMEVILNAATPFQLMSGKVLGVGSVALVQYAAILVTGIVALLLQGQVATIVLGSGSVDLPQGLSVELLLAFGLYGILGFLLYAVLYAAAGSLVSRQEDVNQVVMPMSLVSVAGYMIAVYASTGLLDIRSGALTVLSQVPFVSPFMMLSRITAGEAQLWEVVLSVALLLVTIVAALWIAARIYAAGVLLYGQRPTVRAIWRLVRVGM